MRRLRRLLSLAAIGLLVGWSAQLSGQRAQQPRSTVSAGGEQDSTSTRWTRRTADGQPDLQGTWVNFDDTSFERAPAAAAPPAAGAPDPWTVHASPKSARRTSMVIEPADGRVPLLPAAEAARDDKLAHIGDSWIYETPWVRCITRGVPGGFFPAAYNNAYQIIQVPGYVVIRFEMIHETRIIPIDGRAHLGGAIRQWNGDSRGRWEGNTLVVDTTNYNDKGMVATSAASGRLRGVAQSESMHLVERFTRVDEKTIAYEATIDDPKVYAKPWKVAFPLNLDDSYEIYEYSCHEGNYTMRNELTGGRARDRAAGGAAPPR